DCRRRPRRRDRTAHTGRGTRGTDTTPGHELHNLIDDHRRMDSTRRMFDQFNDLEGVTRHAGRLCHALDQWKHWANGRNLDNTALVEVAAAFADHEDRPGISQLAAPLAQWAQRRGLELQPPTPPTPSRPSMGIEIDS
ncbi:MAG TPA: hypothetical protein VES40_01090, partial [Ilumatobacteraceae bacterium]|nr:hypothetical protein [Ilumatobacteraceae bacterium]